jgi:hypothetical protein
MLDQQGVDLFLGAADACRRLCPRRCAVASRRARSSTASGTRRSYRITSASCSARSALRVRSSGSPGPAPTRVTSPAARGAVEVVASNCCAMRCAPWLSPSMNRRPAGPSTRASKNRRRSPVSRSFWRAGSRSACSQDAKSPILFGDQCFEPLAQAARQHRRRAAGRDCNQHRIAIDDGRHDEARSFAIVDHVDRNIARLRTNSRSNDSPRAAKSRR